MTNPLAPLVFSVASVAALLGACVSSSTNPPSGGPSDSSFCTALKGYLTSCPSQGVSAACSQALIAQLDQNCSTFAADYSVAFKNGTTSCAPAPGCPYGDPYLTPCFQKLVESTSLTAAQTKLANDYCGACAAQAGQTTAVCVADFFGLAGDASIPGAGGVALLYSDALLERIDATCIPAVTDGGAAACGTFATCVQGIGATLAPPPAACTSTPPGVDGGADSGG